VSPDAQSDRAVGCLAAPEIVTLPAEIDLSNSAEVSAELRAAFAPGVTVVVGDLTRTVFCDSSGIRQLLLTHDQAVESQAELRLAIGSDAVRRVLKATGAEQVLSVYPSLEAALAGSSHSASRP
jgi:anti-sigma B factor antagonist